MPEIILIFLKKCWKPLFTVLAGAMAIFGLYFKGRGDQKRADKNKEIKAYLEVTHKIIEQRTKDENAIQKNRKVADEILNDPHSGFVD